VIVGGESGPNARQFEVEWAVRTVKQCRDAGVPVFVKQLGAHIIDRNDVGFFADEERFVGGPKDGQVTNPRGWPSSVQPEDVEEVDGDVYQGADVRIHLSDRKGGDMSEWPEDLRVREFHQ
jgi:hypothetical protein